MATRLVDKHCFICGNLIKWNNDGFGQCENDDCGSGYDSTIELEEIETDKVLVEFYY